NPATAGWGEGRGAAGQPPAVRMRGAHRETRWSAGGEFLVTDRSANGNAGGEVTLNSSGSETTSRSLSAAPSASARRRPRGLFLHIWTFRTLIPLIAFFRRPAELAKMAHLALKCSDIFEHVGLQTLLDDPALLQIARRD